MSMIITPFVFATPAGNTLTADPGSFALTGNAATFKRALRMSAAPGAFGLTGNDANLIKGVTMPAATGAFALTGNDVSFKRSLRMSAATGAFTLTGNAATLSYSNPSDPNFSSVVLLCGFNGTDGATTSSDESSAAHALTFVGNAQLDTAQFKFGASSLLLDGTGDRVTTPDSLDWQLGASNSDPWTVECFVRWNVLDANNRGIMGQNTTGGWTLTGSSTIGELGFAAQNTGTINTSGAAMTTGVWYHVAVDHDATGKIRLFVDGVMRGSATPANSAIANDTNVLTIGAQNQSGSVDMNGWIDEIRITKGVSRYGSDTSFTPPTSAFPRS